MRCRIAMYWLCLLGPLLAVRASGQRLVVSLDGEWSIDESTAPEEMPVSFHHQVRVPGLAHNASPGFPGVDQYVNREYVLKKIRLGLMPSSKAFTEAGRTDQKRNYFWYKTTFRPSAKKEVAVLRVNKAQFGTAVWLNGKKIGEHWGCFTAGVFDLTPAIDWANDNSLLIRIGAHPGALPQWVPAGTDDEKLLWTPGIYDSVSLQLSDNPVIETIQVAPRIKSSEIVIQTRLKNYGGPAVARLDHVVKIWKESNVVARAQGQRIPLQAGESKTITETIRIPNATSDNFRDPERLELEPYFEDYVKEAFKPVGVYINFWQPTLNSSSSRRYRVMMVNDEWQPAKGRLVVSFAPARKAAEVSRHEVVFNFPPPGK